MPDRENACFFHSFSFSLFTSACSCLFTRISFVYSSSSLLWVCAAFFFCCHLFQSYRMLFGDKTTANRRIVFNNNTNNGSNLAQNKGKTYYDLLRFVYLLECEFSSWNETPLFWWIETIFRLLCDAFSVTAFRQIKQKIRKTRCTAWCCNSDCHDPNNIRQTFYQNRVYFCNCHWALVFCLFTCSIIVLTTYSVLHRNSYIKSRNRG